MYSSSSPEFRQLSPATDRKAVLGLSASVAHYNKDTLWRIQGVSGEGCSNLVYGFGFQLEDLQVGLRKGRFAPDWMLSESGVNSLIWHLNRSYPLRQWLKWGTRKEVAVSHFGQERGCLVFCGWHFLCFCL